MIAGAPGAVIESHHLPLPSSSLYFPHPQPAVCDIVLRYLHVEWPTPSSLSDQACSCGVSWLQLTWPCYHYVQKHQYMTASPQKASLNPLYSRTLLPHEDGVSCLNQYSNPLFWLSPGMKSPKWADGSHGCRVKNTFNCDPWLWQEVRCLKVGHWESREGPVLLSSIDSWTCGFCSFENKLP